MQIQNVPVTGARYWAALSIASVFGCNMGDFVARILHLGHSSGLAPLAVVLAVILLLERRAKMPMELYYWLAIVTLRTAATNLGDLATHDFKLSFPNVMAGLAVLLLVILLVEAISPARRAADALAAREQGVPVTNGFYWLAMLTAGTLGTVIGDYFADILELGNGMASVVLSVILAAIMLVRAITTLSGTAFYWLTVVAVRAAGTTVGDYCAGRHGLNLGLPLSTGLTGAALIIALLIWARPMAPTSRAAVA